MNKKSRTNDEMLAKTEATSKKDNKASSKPPLMPCLIFGLGAELLEIHGANRIIRTEHERRNIAKTFLQALKRCDRYKFTEYCNATPTQSTVPCEIFSVDGLFKYRYAFCEKSTLVTENRTIVFLAEDMGQIRCLMSPASLSPSVCGRRIIYELLSFVEMSDTAAEISNTENVASSRMFPTLMRSLISVGNERAPCDIVLLTEAAIQSLCKSPLFLNTSLQFKNTSVDTAMRIIELSAGLYTHILTSFLTVLMTFSVNHIIELEIHPFLSRTENTDLGADVLLSTPARHSIEYGNDKFSPKMLAPAGTTNEILLSATSVIACIAGIDTAARYDHRTGRLIISLSINSESCRTDPDFKYRNPYLLTDAVITDFISALPTIDSQGNGIYFKKRGGKKS